MGYGILALLILVVLFLLNVRESLFSNREKFPQTDPVYVYCRSGRRAGEVIRFLEGKGFTNLINAGGLRDLEGVEIVEGE